jgi:lipid II:glycine glycyltransferase (peptidoglycan interpeptide bridge formation enzyme)
MHATMPNKQESTHDMRAQASSTNYASRLIAELPGSEDTRSWLQLLKRQHAHFFQTPQWFNCLRRGEESVVVLTKDVDEVVGSSVIRRRAIPLSGKAIYVIERGPVCVDEHMLEVHLDQLIELLCKDAVAIRISPYPDTRLTVTYEAVLRQLKWKPVGESSHMYDATLIVDLRQDLKAIQANLRRSLRTQLNKAKRTGIIVRHDTGIEDFEQFITGFNAMARDRGLATIKQEIATELAQLNGRTDGIQLFVCEYDGEIVAGALLIAAGDRIIYRWGFSSESDSHRQLPLSHALHWRAIRWAQENGYRYYDFGGYWEQRGDQDPINRFKLGFSKQIENLMPEHILVLRPFVFGLLKQVVKLRNWLK